MTVGMALRDRLLFAMREAGGAPSSSDLRCNFFVSSTAPLPEPVGLTACGLLRIDRLELRRTCSFFRGRYGDCLCNLCSSFYCLPELSCIRNVFCAPIPSVLEN